ncbi:MAG TPA: aspartate carbamoyltransferase catalytic subunit [candidate division CPR3 bacterium]|uniref:Aspartate carbamoyltransferase n=1 Tax=candidate division CPR3 bacterium TaxID=2268181 RepID=A0A7C1NLU1_UNCC3|nr:aspartate carbamoyltransferase catalytic subunit [candidate division CPR3 bacterium]
MQSLTGRSLITIDDLSNGEIEAIFSIADEMADYIDKKNGKDLCSQFLMASLFYEPSTRTRLSFESAMKRLGGDVLSVTDVQATSLSKGESLSDSIRVIGGYVDLIVLRHSWEGAAKIADDFAGIPVINGGDGEHEHPTQTLCDLYTIKKRKGTIEGLNIAVCGDLKHARAIHSLLYALARFGANIISVPGNNLEIPEYVEKRLTSEYGLEVKKTKQSDIKNLLGDMPIDAIYMTPSQSHQLAFAFASSLDMELRVRMKVFDKLIPHVDALYLTRIQRERFATPKEFSQAKKTYPVVDKAVLRLPKFQKAIVMHPLPRLDELPYEIDKDKRSLYFQQARYGVPVRMALIAALLGVKEVKTSQIPPRYKYKEYRNLNAFKCSNKKCASVIEAVFAKPSFSIISYTPLVLRCNFCDYELRPEYIGNKNTKKAHRSEKIERLHMNPDNLVFFHSKEEAVKQEYKIVNN